MRASCQEPFPELGGFSSVFAATRRPRHGILRSVTRERGRCAGPPEETMGRPNACKCGNLAKAFCVRCDAPLCRRHKEDWLWSWQGCWLPDDVPKKALRAIESGRVPQDDCVLCSQCQSECSRILGQIEDSFLRASKQGEACVECYSDQIRGRCFVCGVGLCSTHGAACQRCQQLGCTQHVTSSDAAGTLCALCVTCSRKKWWQFWK